MKKILTICALLCVWGSSSAQPAETVAKLIRATERLQVRARQVDSLVVSITGSSSHRQLPTAKAVYDYVQSALSGAGGGHVIAESGTGVADKDTLNYSNTGQIGFSVSNSATSTDVTADINDLGATMGQVLRFSGSAWVPNGINLYDVVTTSQTVGAQYNQVFVDTLTAGITLNLAPCNAANDGVRFEFVKTGPDLYPVDIEPAGSETFVDGSATKTIFSLGTPIICTCRWNGTVGKWFFINM